MASSVLFADVLNEYLNRQDRNSAWLADRLDLSRSTVSRWTNGETRPRSSNYVIRIADVLSLYDKEDRSTLLRAYHGVEVIESFISDHLNDDWGEKQDELLAQPVGWTMNSLWNALHSWWHAFVRWEDAPEHQIANWEGKVLWIMGSLFDRLKTGPVLYVLSALSLWVVAAWLMTPFLRWPLDVVEVRRQASVNFAAASILFPLLIALFVRPLDYDDFLPQNRRDSFRLILLKVAGAFNGFSAFAAVLVFPVLLWHYAVGRPLPAGLCWLMTIVPLLFSYVAARRTPSDRFRMFHGTMRMHEADSLFLGVGIFLVPVLSLYVYFAYPVLQSGYFGFLVLLALIGVLLWEHRKRHPDFLKDGAAILVLGLLIPGVMQITFIVMPILNTESLLNSAPVLALLVMAYFFSETVLVATLFVRNPPVLTLRGMLVLLGILLIALVVLTQNLLVGRIFVLLLLFLWTFWGRSRFRIYHAVHPAFSVHQVGLILSVFALVRTNVNPWLNLAIFLLFTAGMVGWAYRKPS